MVTPKIVKVKELMEVLKELDPNWEVWIMDHYNEHPVPVFNACAYYLDDVEEKIVIA